MQSTLTRPHHNRGFMQYKVMTSWDDGNKYDMKLAEILVRYNIPATFYLPSICDLSQQAIKAFSKNFEIGGHTHSHTILRDVSVEIAKVEIMDNKKYLEKIIGREITSFCYPRGRYNEEVVRLVRECGFKEARTTLVYNTKLTGSFNVDPTIHVYPRKEYKGKKWIGQALQLFDEVMDNGGYFHLWGHSWEVEKLNEWGNLEKFLAYMSERLKQ